MNNKPNIDILELASGVVDYMWNSSSPQIEIDHTARLGAANRLIQFLPPKIAGLNQEDAYSELMSLLMDDSDFKNKIQRVIETTISRFERHYIKFGGKSALFVFCLLRSLNYSDSSKINKAKVSLINWYEEHRRLDIASVNGGMVSAWWPFEWFSANFDAIATSVIAAVFYDASKKVLINFFQAYEPAKKAFDPFPESILKGKSPDQTIDEFRDKLNEAGLIDQFLYLFKLSDEELCVLIDEWVQAFRLFHNSLMPSEKRLILQLIESPICWRPETNGFSALREQNIIRIIEPNQNELWLSLYPQILDQQ